MNDTQLYSALREWRQVMANFRTISVIGAVALVLTVAAPFETDTILRFVPRFAYWLATIACTYSVGFMSSRIVTTLIPQRVGPAVRVIVTGGVTAISVALVVLVLNVLALGYWPAATDLPVFMGTICLIAFLIAIIFEVLSDNAAPAAGPFVPPQQQPAILDRLPLDKRGALLALSVQDHYVNVATANGTHMILMRLTDAIREVGATRGLRVHRSHWVALAAVTQATRKGDGAVLTLSNGADIPVSRSNLAAIKQAGLLPKVAND